MGEDKRKGNNAAEDQKNLLEWGVFFLGLLIIVSVFAYLVYQTLNYKPSSPELLVEFKPDPTEGQPYRYHVRVRNIGGETAESVVVELNLKQEGGVEEKAELQVMFVPQESNREGWVNFTRKPASEKAVSARVASYQKP